MYPHACVLLLFILVGYQVTIAEPVAAQEVAAFHAARETYIDTYRRTGEHPLEPLVALEQELFAVLDAAPAESRGSLLVEIASMQRLQFRLEEAIATYEAALAEGVGREVAFDAWIRIAQIRAQQTKDHGAADEALQNALAAAGENPTRKNRYELAANRALLQNARGEIEAALSNALEASRLAATDDERYFAEIGIGDTLGQFAQSCHYRQLIDAKTYSDESDDGWGACRRAVAAASKYYAQSAEIAARVGWDHMRASSESSGKRLSDRLSMIENRAAWMKQMAALRVFATEDAAKIVVNEDFSTGGQSIDQPEMAEAIGEFVDGLSGMMEFDPGADVMSAFKADIEGNAEAALFYLERAAAMLENQRASLFDVRQRGTAVENRSEAVSMLGLRLLALDSYDRAFAVFESIRAKGLGDLAASYETQAFSAAERWWLARLVDLESQESAVLTELVEGTIAGEIRDLNQMLDALQAIRARRAAHMSDQNFSGTLGRLAAAPREPVGLEVLTSLVESTGVPVLFYWVTRSNVVVWAVSPKGMEVKTVFLPEEVVIEKVRRVTRSASTANQPFDAEAARQLYAYLVRPFERHLAGDEVIIVPQGPLVALPFETLIDGRSKQFMVENVAVSYAPSAAFAAKALRRDPLVLSSVTAVYDEAIESDTGEIARLRGSLTTEVEALPTRTLSAEEAINVFGGNEALHVLLHGYFERADPLQSHLSLENLDLSREDNAVTAAELLASDWRRARIVVFSSCESAQMNVRISNEVYGLSWAPLAGGSQAVVTSRWRVLGPSNADWMEDFYGRLTAGAGSPAIAAAGTMRRMIHETGADPYYWAGPQVFGR